MNILLITNYWSPYNSPGTFRWWNFAQFMNMDILTNKKPLGARYDPTIEGRGNKVYRVSFYCCPAFLAGIFLSVIAWYYRKDYDLFIFTSPPETLLIGAFLLQVSGKKVLVDMRDSIDRPGQPIRILIPFYKWLYGKIKNVIVTWGLIDSLKPVIHSGHDNLKLFEKYSHNPVLMNEARVYYKTYNFLLRVGFIPDISKKRKGYVSSALINVRHLWGDKVNMDHLHPEIRNLKPRSWAHQFCLLTKVLEKIVIDINRQA